METRACVRCLIEKEAAAFPSHKGQIHGARCKPCLAEIRRVERANAPPKPPRPLDRDRTEKRCKRCHVVKPVSEFIWAGERWSAACRPCTSELRKARWRKDIEASRARSREVDRRRKEERAPKRHAHYLTNRERVAVQTKARYRRLRDQLLAQNRAWREANREYVAAYQRQYQPLWRRANIDRMHRYGAEYRARKIKATIGLVDRQAIIERDGGVCYLCGKKPRKGSLELDHVVALRDGGTHSEDNLRPACRSCNAKKNRMPIAVFLRRQNIPSIQARLL